MSTVVIKINTVDKSSLINWESVKKNEVLGKEPSTLEFAIRSSPTKTYLPSINDTVQMYDNGALVFAGNISEIDTQIEGLLKTTTCVCKDFLGLADGKVVAKVYTSQTGTQIVQDIFTTFVSGFTTTHVNCPVVLDAMRFNYLTVAQAMQKLMQSVGGGYDWYIDYNMDVHVYQTGAVVAPFSLDDTSGNHVYGSLNFKNDFSQIKNSITVRGTNNTSAAINAKLVADGAQIIFPVGYFNMTGFSASKALAASPTTFTALNVGVDGLDDPTAFDCLYNSQEGLLRFPTASRPAAGDVIAYSGTPTFPIISQVKDPVSIAQYGVYEYVIVDRSIASKSNARNKANAELLLYGQPIITGSFRTSKSGLIAGQVMAINCPAIGLSGAFKIQKIATRLRTPSSTTSDFWFDIDFVSTTTVTMTDVLNRLLNVDPSTQVEIDGEIIDNAISPYETITVGESIAINSNVFFETEGMTVSESFVDNGLNFGTIFVAGVYTPTGGSDPKRQFLLNSSPLG